MGAETLGVIPGIIDQYGAGLVATGVALEQAANNPANTEPIAAVQNEQLPTPVRVEAAHSFVQNSMSGLIQNPGIYRERVAAIGEFGQQTAGLVTAVSPIVKMAAEVVRDVTSFLIDIPLVGGIFKKFLGGINRAAKQVTGFYEKYETQLKEMMNAVSRWLEAATLMTAAGNVLASAPKLATAANTIHTAWDRAQTAFTLWDTAKEKLKKKKKQKQEV
jgi:hypothetical protein